MLEAFLEFIEKNKLFSRSDRILAAVSGGADSVALLDLLLKAGFNVAVAHCNFKLRGEESDRDENFVRKLAEKYGLQIFIKICKAQYYAEEKGISVEMAARELRYQFFDGLIKKYNFDFIATAHNADDNVETVLLNIARKTGIAGLTGIPVKNGKIVRPLLFAFKKDILQYCKENSLEFVEDSTNRQTVFQRNKIRHKIIPVFEEINPAFKRNLLETIGNLAAVREIFHEKLASFISKCIEQKVNEYFIDIQCVKKEKFAQPLLFEFLKKFGFNSSVVSDIFLSLDGQPGKIFKSTEFTLLKDRRYLILKPVERNDSGSNVFLIQPGLKILDLGNRVLKISVREIDKNFKIHPGRNFAFLDLDKLTFPLKVRKWRPGDKFVPLGMKGYKKLSDFFNDLKIPLFEKQKILIVESGGEIAWVVNYRISEKFKITAQSSKALILELFPKNEQENNS